MLDDNWVCIGTTTFDEFPGDFFVFGPTEDAFLQEEQEKDERTSAYQ